MNYQEIEDKKSLVGKTVYTPPSYFYEPVKLTITSVSEKQFCCGKYTKFNKRNFDNVFLTRNEALDNGIKRQEFEIAKYEKYILNCRERINNLKKMYKK